MTLPQLKPRLQNRRQSRTGVMPQLHDRLALPATRPPFTGILLKRYKRFLPIFSLLP